MYPRLSKNRKMRWTRGFQRSKDHNSKYSTCTLKWSHTKMIAGLQNCLDYFLNQNDREYDRTLKWSLLNSKTLDLKMIAEKASKSSFLYKIAKATTIPNCLVLAVFQLFSPFHIPPINQKLTFCSKMIAQYYDRCKMIVPKSFDYFWNENDRKNDRSLIWSLAKKSRL